MAVMLALTKFYIYIFSKIYMLHAQTYLETHSQWRTTHQTYQLRTLAILHLY